MPLRGACCVPVASDVGTALAKSELLRPAQNSHQISARQKIPFAVLRAIAEGRISRSPLKK
jgi:hypothetical protein